MADDEDVSRAERIKRLRREPPAFRVVAVRAVSDVTPRLRRVVVGGDALEGFDEPDPGASVRVLLPDGDGTLTLPEWDGNEFLAPDGSRPTIRTITPRHRDPARNELTLDFVVHGGGAASQWAAAASPGDQVAVSGPGRGWHPPEGASTFLLAGDETALPAISQLLEVLAASHAGATVDVVVEVGSSEARHDLPAHPRCSIAWFELGRGDAPGAALVPAVEAADIGADTVVWVAGEAAAVQKVRKHLFDQRGLARSQATVRGYWKHGRAAGGADDD